MGKRRRITKELIGEIVIDELAYSQNKGSLNARKIVDKSEQVHIEIWYDKHYVGRAQLGDENGKRVGIEEAKIQELVSKSIKHLIYYSFQVKNFIFVSQLKHNTHSLRVVIQQSTNDGTLNIVLGFCHIDANRYEVTVYTAMVVDDFRIGDGQYVVTLENNDGSSLSKMDNRRLVELDINP